MREEEKQNYSNSKEMYNANYYNPKLVFDGKRMRILTVRRTLDYASNIVYKKYFPDYQSIGIDNKFFINTQPVLGKKYINESHLLYFKEPLFCSPEEAVTSKFAHISINKMKCPVNVVKYTPHGKRLISGTGNGEFTLWNGSSFNFETILQAHETAVRSLCWSPSGQFLVSGDSLGVIKFWHPSMLNLLKLDGHSEPVRDISFSMTDAKFCTASDDGSIKIWDSKSAKEEGILKGHGWDVRVAHWHPEYSLIASGGKDNLVKLWDPRAKKELNTLYIHRNTILALKWSRDGKYLLSGGKDQVVKKFDLRAFNEAFSYKNHKKEVSTICTHPFIDDLFVSGGTDGGLYFWQMFEDTPLKIVEQAHDNIIWGMDYHPLGHVLASGSMDNSVRFWVRDRPNEVVETKECYEKSEVKVPGLKLIEEDENEVF